MAKIVIIAPSGAEDIDDAVKLLRSAGHDVEIEEPTAKTLLHIVLGLMGPSAYGFGAGYAYKPGTKAEDADKDDEDEDENKGDADTEEDTDGDAGGDSDFNFEGVMVDGVPVKAIKTDNEHTVFEVKDLIKTNGKVVYTVNESVFTFYPSEENTLRVLIEQNQFGSTKLVQIKKGNETVLKIGKDLIQSFK
jgi:hypothetical protein